MVFKDTRFHQGEDAAALEGMIFSASGWRGVFAAAGGESGGGEVPPARLLFAAAAAEVFAAFLQDGGRSPRIIVGTDTRPTGPAIAEAVISALAAGGSEVFFPGITAAPEIMAYARSLAAPGTGFLYISASHNPIGHNGLKFGRCDGGVLSGPETAKLAGGLRALLSGPERIAGLKNAVNGLEAGVLKGVYGSGEAHKKAAYAAYLAFSRGVAFGGGAESGGLAGAQAGGTENGGADLAAAIRQGLAERPLGIVCDFNGSARTLSIDREFLSSLGISFRAMNSGPGEIKHRIIPEGESLEPCRRFLEEAHAEDPACILGYVPDCDGDRGNLVFWDETAGAARILEAQEVFALTCAAELAHLVWTGELAYDNRGNALNKAALAVNDPTSMRIDRIARAFDVPVFRAEVGEANVVGLARNLREKGYQVRILGEGSNGGSITHPAAVRDPLNTILALVKLLTVRSREGKQGFFEIWCDLSEQAETWRPNFSLDHIIASLPAFVSTPASSPESQIQVRTADHGALKNRYQELFLRDWEERKDLLKTRYGVSGWEAAACNGMEERRGISSFGEAGRGGLKISFLKSSGHPAAFIWMRGSATEPVFRIMADVEGSDKRLERSLIEWQRRLVAEADNKE
ncbi:MAG: phosphatidylglycerol lysyltransferase [Treponema sp.]|jgi:phosphoglucomutase|nr:phosphatidylglycerol lysyltransferase [Treponema sp.]